MKKQILLLALSAILFGCKEQSKHYNVLFIVADDMNEYGFFHTNPEVKTPNLDKFKITAVSFRHSYCAAPACSPSRTAFLSGLAPYKTGKYYNGSTIWEKPIMQDQETMPEWFKRIGYSSYGKGKLFHSNISKERVARSFDGNTGKAGFGPFPDSINQIIPCHRFRGMQAFPDGDFPDVLNANDIIKILQSDHEKPFFLMYGLWRPHSPYTCPQRFYDMYNLDDIKIPKGFKADDADDLPAIAQGLIQSDSLDFNTITATERQWKEYLRGYYACYSFADWNIGRVLDALNKSKYAENTIVVVTSDNGFHMGEKNRFDKNSLWEESAITSMAIRIPGTPNAGKVCMKTVNLQDLFPTFVDYCGNGVMPKKAIDGVSIRPLLENPEADWGHPSITYFGKDWVSVRNERFRYLYYSDGSEELYDHQNDNWEWNNLANDPNYTKVIEELKKYVPKDMAASIPGRWTKAIHKIEENVRANESSK